MKYHGISAYQFYTALKHVDEGTAPEFTHGNSNLSANSAQIRPNQVSQQAITYP
jgi:hypothetical protein